MQLCMYTIETLNFHVLPSLYLKKDNVSRIIIYYLTLSMLMLNKIPQ